MCQVPCQVLGDTTVKEIDLASDFPRKYSLVGQPNIKQMIIMTSIMVECCQAMRKEKPGPFLALPY